MSARSLWLRSSKRAPKWRRCLPNFLHVYNKRPPSTWSTTKGGKGCIKSNIITAVSPPFPCFRFISHQIGDRRRNNPPALDRRVHSPPIFNRGRKLPADRTRYCCVVRTSVTSPSHPRARSLADSKARRGSFDVSVRRKKPLIATQPQPRRFHVPSSCCCSITNPRLFHEQVKRHMMIEARHNIYTKHIAHHFPFPAPKKGQGRRCPREFFSALRHGRCWGQNMWTSRDQSTLPALHPGHS